MEIEQDGHLPFVDLSLADNLIKLQQVSTGRSPILKNTPLFHQIDQEQNSWGLLRACFIVLITFKFVMKSKDTELIRLSYSLMHLFAVDHTVVCVWYPPLLNWGVSLAPERTEIFRKCN